MKIISLLSLFFLLSCNPELQNIGATDTDVVKYFKVTDLGGNSLGDGILILSHIGEKKLLTFYLKQPSGNYAHTDVTIKSGGPSLFLLDSVYSQTPDCKLAPDLEQPAYFESLSVGGIQKPYNLMELTREEAMKLNRKTGC